MNVHKLVLAMSATLCALACGLAFSIAPAFAAKEYVQTSTFGEKGHGAGQVNEPEGVAVNESTGDVYVADPGNARVDEFESDGTFVRAWGWGVSDEMPMFETCTAISGCQRGVEGSGPGQFEHASFIAVDNASGPSAGDVYVGDLSTNTVDKFTATGAYICELSGSSRRCLKEAGEETKAEEETPSFSELYGVAVDRSGNLWVSYGKYSVGFRVAEFNGTSTLLKVLSTETGFYYGIALDSAENVYVVDRGSQVYKLSGSTGDAIGEPFDHEVDEALAIDPSDQSLFVDQREDIQHYGPYGEPNSAPLQSIPNSGQKNGYNPDGLAVNGTNGTLYATRPEENDIAIYQPFLFPSVSVSAPSISETSVTLHGSVDPEGEKLEECQFEYGFSEAEPGQYEHSEPCEPSAAAIGVTNKTVAVSATLTLQPRSTYHYRLTARAARAKSSPDQSFFTATKPQIEGESERASGIEATGATVSAQVDAAGLQTTYFVEYGPSAAYGSLTQQLSLGDPQEATEVSFVLGSLAPASEYHLRFVAVNADGTKYGADYTFSTAAASTAAASTLPDGRAYELVSPAGEELGSVFAPSTLERVGGNGLLSQYAQQVSPDGEAAVYIGAPPSSGGNGASGGDKGDQYLASRTPEGWRSRPITPSGAPIGSGYFEGFSPDLSIGTLSTPTQLPVTVGDKEGCSFFYAGSTGDEDYTLLAPSVENAECAAEKVFAGGNEGTASVPAFSHILFGSPAALVTGAEPAPGEGQDNLYDFSGGVLHPVNVLAGKIVPSASFGSYASSEEFDFSNVISADGSRVYWTDLQTGVVYLREADATTIQVSTGAAKYWTATGDGHYAYYTEAGELWQFDADAEADKVASREVLAGEGLDPGESAGVQGVVGASRDGSYIYYVATGVIAENTREYRNFDGEEVTEGAKPGEDNLYLDHEGVTTFVATLAAADNEGPRTVGNYAPFTGDWKGDLQADTAEVTPDGQHLVFESHEHLTGYDNDGFSEIFDYDAQNNLISCASCNPNGTPPSTRSELADFLGGQPTVTYQPRWISEDGKRVFFDSNQALVPQEKRSEGEESKGVESVYEWEQDGEGTCQTTAGCVFLLSGAAQSPSLFVDASASGDDVFFTSRDRLVPQDDNELVDLYDARVGGGFPVPASRACTGTGCQGLSSPPPVFATPASATFTGIGNFPAAAKASVKKKASRPLTRAQKLARALKECGALRSKSKRVACRERARRLYGKQAKPSKRDRAGGSGR